MRIREIVKEKKGKRIVHTDEGIVFPIYAREAADFKLEEGGEITSECWERICIEILYKRATKRAMHILQQMERTEYQLRQKLKDNNYPEAAIDAAIEYVKKYHYVDDYRYACVYVRYHQSDSSRMQLKMKLQQRGVNRDLIEQALDEEYEADESEMIIRLLEKKHYHPDMDYKEKMKVYQYLMRRGFSSSVVSRCMNM